MVDHTFDAHGSSGRIEIITGVERRRSWSPEEKGRIVAQTLKRGAVISEVARANGLRPQQVFGWRYLARTGQLVLPVDETLSFAPVVVEDPLPAAPVKPPSKGLSIEMGAVVVKVDPGVDPELLGLVMRALRDLK